MGATHPSLGAGRHRGDRRRKPSAARAVAVAADVARSAGGQVAEADPAAIGIDIVMPEADRLSPGRLPEFVPGIGQDLTQRLSRLPSNDAVLARTLQTSPVVLGVAGLEPDAGPRRPVRRVPFRIVGGDPTPLVRRFEATLHSAEEIDRVVKGHGLLNVDTERGVVRRMPPVAAVGDELVPSFGIEILRVAIGEPVLTVRTGASGVEAVGVGDLFVPTERDGSVRLHFARPDPERFVSAADLLAGKVDRQLLERKLVLIGVTALGLSDYQATPAADRMSGVEIHAQLLENMFDTDLLTRPRAAARLCAARSSGSARRPRASPASWKPPAGSRWAASRTRRPRFPATRASTFMRSSSRRVRSAAISTTSSPSIATGSAS